MGITCEHCCGADLFFDNKAAKKQMRTYLKKGSKGVTKKLIKAIQSKENKNKSLLDIGGGVGAVQWYFLQKPDTTTTDIDASSSYLKLAQEYAQKNNWEKRAKFIQSDFIDYANQLKIHDIVTMDKVVCCYPDYHKLLTLALSKSKHTFALSYPMGGYIAKFIAEIENFYLNLKKNPFRPYIHSPKAIRELITSQGFVNVYRSTKFPWHIEVYERTKR